MARFVAYYRVSTGRQGRSGLGLEAQQAAVAQHLARGGELVASFTEVESGKRSDRPELLKALGACRRLKATLVVAKLDRLSRNAAFLLTLRDAGVAFVACDMPDANSLTIGILAVVAQHEREAISKRTTEALAAAAVRLKRESRKANGKATSWGGFRLGAPDPGRYARKASKAAVVARIAKADKAAAKVLPLVRSMKAQGLSLRGIAQALTDQGEPSPRGGAWGPQSVANLLARAA